MFLHLGGEFSLLQKEIIGIFDFETIMNSQSTKEYLEIASSEKEIVKIAENEKTKSIIITQDKVYYSPISSITLQKRAQSMNEMKGEPYEQRV